MTTKERILETSRLLFNKIGVDNVSARVICSELKISPGNFSYYFTNKNQIIGDLFQCMTLEVQSALNAVAGSEVNILVYLESHKLLFLIQQKYKFFYLNLFEILTNNPEVKDLYLRNSNAERTMAKRLLQIYVDKGVLRKGISDEQYDRMINVGQILNNSWLVDAEILFKGNQKKKLGYYMNICCGLLEPFLTENSSIEYKRFFKNL